MFLMSAIPSLAAGREHLAAIKLLFPHISQFHGFAVLKLVKDSSHVFYRIIITHYGAWKAEAPRRSISYYEAKSLELKSL
jgi:hypothetical protein